MPSEIFVQWLKLRYLFLMNSRSSRKMTWEKIMSFMQYTSKYSVKIQSYGTSAVKESLFFCWCRDRNRYRKNANLRRVPLHLTRHLKSHTTHRQLSREEKSQWYIYIIIVNRKKGGITYLSCDTNREQDRYLCVWFLTVVNCIILCQNIQLARPIKRGFQALFRFQLKRHWQSRHES